MMWLQVTVAFCAPEGMRALEAATGCAAKHLLRDVIAGAVLYVCRCTVGAGAQTAKESLGTITNSSSADYQLAG
jgi:hypothetical protein